MKGLDKLHFSCNGNIFLKTRKIGMERKLLSLAKRSIYLEGHRFRRTTISTSIRTITCCSECLLLDVSRNALLRETTVLTFVNTSNVKEKEATTSVPWKYWLFGINKFEFSIQAQFCTKVTYRGIPLKAFTCIQFPVGVSSWRQNAIRTFWRTVCSLCISHVIPRDLREIYRRYL